MISTLEHKETWVDQGEDAKTYVRKRLAGVKCVDVEVITRKTKCSVRMRLMLVKKRSGVAKRKLRYMLLLFTQKVKPQRT